ncbi:MAG TPA: nuclease-related domain-containing protein [Acidimicrobiales bacterium]|nr:nuclease-related domain-containing protein [Acidimicrobiales bacterium]
MRTEPTTGHGHPGRSAAAAGAEARRVARRRRVQTGWWAVVAVGLTVVALAVPAGAGRVAAAAGAVVAGGLAVVCRPRRDPDRWVRGASGERATAVLLAGLPPSRWVVLHDRRLPGSRANVDHLVIGRRGVWVVDSKAYRAPLRAGWRGVWVGERRLDIGPVAWEASVVADLLDVDVRPLVVVHGEGLPRRGRRCDGVRVLPAESVVRHLRRARTGVRLSFEDVDDLADEAECVLPEA